MTTPHTPGPLVTAAWLAHHLDDVVVADVRWYLDGRSGKEAYHAGHVPGAVFVDLDVDLSGPAGPEGRHPLPSPDAFAGAMSALGVGDDSVVIAYDDAGGMVAGRMWWMLDALGVAAAVLDGGIQAWTGPLETATRSIEPAAFTSRPWPTDRFATADDVADRPDDVTLLDARSAARYRGDANAIDPRFGHIPGAQSAPWTDVIGDNGHFLPADELTARSIALGISTGAEAEADSPVIAYCGSGVSACADLLALRLAGHRNQRLYVGSWSEWGADERRPLERADRDQPAP